MVEQIQTILSQVRILPRRLSLLTPGVRATVPMLRGVWGAALHDLAPEAYCSVFLGHGAAHERVPLFVLRPAPPCGPGTSPLEWGWGLQGAAFTFAPSGRWIRQATCSLRRASRAAGHFF